MKERNRTFVPTAIAVLIMLASAGCQDLKKIPIFNPQAKTINRIGSAYETLTELNGMCADAVIDGLVSQETVDKTVGVQLDSAHTIIGEAETLFRAGKIGESTSKLESANAILRAVRAQLLQIQQAKGPPS